MTESFSVCRLGKRHLEEVAEIERLCFHNPWSAESLSLLLKDENFAYVALDGDRAVAYAGLVTALDEGEITNVATHPDYRRRGLAREVLSALLGAVGARGIRRVTLEVRPSNVAALSLYGSLGFRECGRRRNFYSFPREDALLWAWENPMN